VAQRAVAPQRTQERLLERVLGAITPDAADKEREHAVTVLDVEAFERGDGHGLHHRLERPGTRKCETPAVRVAVVGHVEWIQFARVEQVPAPGEIVTAEETWEEAAGGGAVAAVQLAKLNGGCTFYTLLGDDELGRKAQAQLRKQGVEVEAEFVPRPTRRGFTFVDAAGERTITVFGDKLHPSPSNHLPWIELARCDAVYFTAGDVGALEAARRAGVELDALVGSGEDMSEQYQPGDLEPAPKLVVSTAGPLGGWTQPGGPFRAAPLPGTVSDAYGAGDSFSAGLTFALGKGMEREQALELASRCGAAVMTGQGPYEGQLSADDLD
jgi:ribokinase